MDNMDQDYYVQVENALKALRNSSAQSQPRPAPQAAPAPRPQPAPQAAAKPPMPKAPPGFNAQPRPQPAPAPQAAPKPPMPQPQQQGNPMAQQQPSPMSQRPPMPQPQQQAPSFNDGGMLSGAPSPMPMTDPSMLDAGASPVEKADDVKANLSEGEYVIPAEVVRYIGLEGLENMVNQVKAKIGGLEDEGRIQEGQATPDPMEMEGESPMPEMAGEEGMMPPGFSQGGLVRRLNPYGGTIYTNPGESYIPGQNILGGRTWGHNSSNTDKKEDTTEKKSDNTTVADTMGEGTNPGGESDPNTNDVNAGTFGSMDAWGDAVDAQMGPIGKDFAAQVDAAVEQFGKDKEALGRGIAGLFGGNEVEAAGYGGTNAGDGSSGVDSSDNEDGTDDGVGSGVEGGMGTTGGHDDGGEDSSDSSDAADGAAGAGASSGGQEGNDAGWAKGGLVKKAKKGKKKGVMG